MKGVDDGAGGGRTAIDRSWRREGNGGWTSSGGRSGRRHQEVAADARAQLVDAVQELREEGVQAGRQDLVDVAVLQVGAQLAGAALRLAPTGRWPPSPGWLTTSFRLACSERGMSGRRISRSATRSGLITSR